MPSPARDTIFALSSGRPPAAIAVVRISGPRARDALAQTIGRVPAPRRATLAKVCDPATGDVIDEGLALWFPAPKSATGEYMAELFPGAEILPPAANENHHCCLLRRRAE